MNINNIYNKYTYDNNGNILTCEIIIPITPLKVNDESIQLLKNKLTILLNGDIIRDQIWDMLEYIENNYKNISKYEVNEWEVGIIITTDNPPTRWLLYNQQNKNELVINHIEVIDECIETYRLIFPNPNFIDLYLDEDINKLDYITNIIIAYNFNDFND